MPANGKNKAAPAADRGSCAATVQQRVYRSLSEDFVHCAPDPAIHALEDVRVGVQRLRYRSVA